MASELCKRWNAEYHHEGPPKDGDLLMHYGLQIQRAREDGHNHVFDRLALGELVYGPILRGQDRIGVNGWRVFMRLLEAADVRRVLCRPPYEQCLYNWTGGVKSETELFTKRDVFNLTYAAYLKIQDDGEPVEDYAMYEYDYTAPEIEGSSPFNRLMGFLTRPPSPIVPHHVIGSRSARYLLVGERGSNLNSPLDLPFYGVTDSALYLTRALDDAGFGEGQLAFVNAYSLTSVIPRALPRTYERVIALGEKASEVCALQNLTHEGVPHPQFWRRFHHHDVRSYADMLKGCRT